MTVAVTGASGNLGTALLRRLTAPGAGVAEVRGLARRQPPDVAPYSGVRWHLADLGDPDSEAALAEFLDGVDAVVHLAWALQPGRQPDQLRRVNVEGTRRVVRAAGAAGVRHVVHMSSIGAYAAGAVGPAGRPRTGRPPASRARSTAGTSPRPSGWCARSPADHPDMTLTVVRPTLVLQPDAGSEIGRYFLGPLLFGARPAAARRGGPAAAAAAARRARSRSCTPTTSPTPLVRILDRRAPGPFNLAAEPLMDADALARALGHAAGPGARRSAARPALQAAFTAHLVPDRAGLARHRHPGAGAGHHPRPDRLLDWAPVHRGDEVLREFVAALGRGEGAPGPLLRPAGGRALAPAG